MMMQSVEALPHPTGKSTSKGVCALKKKKSKVRPLQSLTSVHPMEGLGEEQSVRCTVAQQTAESSLSVDIEAPFVDGSAVLHWGQLKHPGSEWYQTETLPPKTIAFGDGKAAQTTFEGTHCHLTFPREGSPSFIAFVISQREPEERWWKAQGCGDFVVSISGESSLSAEPKEDELDRRFVDAEAFYSNWSQFQRFCLCLDLLKGRLTFAESCWMTTVLRLAKLRLVDWFRKYNYQPKDLAHVQQELAVNLALRCADGSLERRTRGLLRLCMLTVPRGSSNCGDGIRMGILNIMRSHGIREGHRPGIECRFLEQWHQKLHTNSAPDDIVICEAYLKFLDSNNEGDFWGHLYHAGNLTREKLSALPQPITATPLFLPQVKGDMWGFLGLLKSIHSGADLDYLAECCKGQIEHGAECAVFDILRNRHEWWIAGKINECRGILKKDCWKRDVMMMDCALESFQMTKLGASHIENLSQDECLGILTVLLESLRLSRGDDDVEAAITFYHTVLGMNKDDGKTWAKLMLAALERVGLVSMSVVDECSASLQNCVRKLVEAINSPNSQAIQRFESSTVAAFGEEVSRGLCELHISRCLRRLIPSLRKGAGLGAWEAISYPEGRGRGVTGVSDAKVWDNLSDFTSSCSAAIVFCRKLTGWEDIPIGVRVLLVGPGDGVDMLSHIAIRARTQKVLLATCAEEDVWEKVVATTQKIMSTGKKNVLLSISIDSHGDLTVTEAEVVEENGMGRTTAVASSSPTSSVASPIASTTASPSHAEEKIEMKPPTLVLQSSEFENHKQFLGGKSLNLSSLKDSSDMKSDVGVFQRPLSIALPFGVMEKELSLPENEDISRGVKDIQKLLRAEPSQSEANLMLLRAMVVEDMEQSQELIDAMTAALTTSGVLENIESKPQISDILTCVRKVWASKWTSRAVSSRRSCGLLDSRLFMAVLVQNLIDADYAFVIHTTDPRATVSSPCPGSLVEVVVGLGECLVSNSPGAPLSASIRPTSEGENVIIDVHRFPSKAHALFAHPGGTLICRSDSNGEDLPNFAGAGLYDSFALASCQRRVVNYSHDRLVRDDTFRSTLLRKLYFVGQEVLRQLQTTTPQDIEGCVKGDSVFVLQTRPQM